MYSVDAPASNTRSCKEIAEVLMFQKASSAIVDSFENFGIVNNENREIYLFGIQQILTLLLNAISMLVIGFLFHQIFQCILYMALFIPLRSFAGGYHANSPQRCYVYSVACVTIAMIIIKLDFLNELYYYCIAVVSGILIFMLAPVEDHNKPLDDLEVEHYRLRTRVILTIEGLFFACAMVLNWKNVVLCITLAFLTLGLMLIAGKIKNRNIR